jgi:ABC-type nitrate/sulfonate/bicarbonate transport system permease component
MVGRPGAGPLAGVLASRSIPLLSIAALLVAWEAAGQFLHLPWLPPFSAVAVALVDLVQRGEIGLDLLTSLRSLAIGLAIALVIGVPVGALMGRYRRVDQALNIYVYTLFVAPNVVFVPVFFAMFGLSPLTIIAVVVLYAVFVLIINVRTGVKYVDVSLLEMAESFGASSLEQMRLVTIPASLPMLLTGVRLAVGRSVKGMINGEMFIAVVGIGGLSRKYGSQFDMSHTFAIVVVILIIALVLNGVVQWIETRLTRWMD